jgi:hypothetical protein
MHINLGTLISTKGVWVSVTGLTSLFSAPSAMWKRVCWQDTWIEVGRDVILCGFRCMQYLDTMLQVLACGRCYWEVCVGS